MRKLWLFGIVMLLSVAMAMATPTASHPSINSTINGTASLFSVYWNTSGSPAKNLSCYIFQSDNSGTGQNLTPVCWALGMDAGWSYSTIILNETPDKTVNWKVYANESGNAWGTYSSDFKITEAETFSAAHCPVDNTPTALIFILIGALLLAMAIIGYTWATMPIWNMIVGLAMVFYSFPLYGCMFIYGGIITSFGIMVASMAVISWRKG